MPPREARVNYACTLANSSLYVTNVTFTGNTATSNGGAIYAASGTGPVDVNDSYFGSSTIPGNAATGDGGAIDYEGSYSLTITNTSFVDNTAGNSGTAGNGGAVEIGDQCDAATLTNCQFGTSVGSVITNPSNPPLQEQGNKATGNGGAIDYEGQLLNSSYLYLTDVTFLQNKAGDGGAVYAGSGTGPVTVNGSYFGNVVPSTGGGVSLIQFFDGNQAVTGGAIYDFGASLLTINATSFLVNSVEGGDGGAIYYSGTGGLNIGGNSVFTSNSATNSFSGGKADGGAIYIASTGSSNIVIYSTSFTNNEAVGATGTQGAGGQGGAAAGGAIENLSGSLTITNSSFTGNQARGGNGGIGSQWGNGGPGGGATGGAPLLPWGPIPRRLLRRDVHG